MGDSLSAMFRPAFAFCALVMSSGVGAQGRSERSSAEQAALDRAIERGRTIYAYDQAAWHGTDDFRARMPAALAAVVAGYVVDGPSTTPRLIFFDRQPEPHAVYIAHYKDGRLTDAKFLGDSDDRTIPAPTLRMIRALSVARAALTPAKATPCGPAPFNTVVLPPATPETSVAVYFLTPQATNEAIPFGGHYEIDVDRTGHAEAPRRFTNTCLTVTPRPPKGGTSVSVFVTHLLDPTPTEIHVFTSLSLHLPVMVGTMKPTPRLWAVTGTTISGPTSVALPASR